MKEKVRRVQKYWGNTSGIFVDYGAIDVAELRTFAGSHPAVMAKWLATEAEQSFSPRPGYRLNLRDVRNRVRFKIEETFDVEISKKHYTKLD